MKTLPVWTLLALVAVTTLMYKTEAKGDNLVLHKLTKRSPGHRSRERHGGSSRGRYGGYGGYGYGGYSHGGRSRGGRSRGRHGGRSHGGYSHGGRSHGGHSHGGHSHGGHSHGGRSHGGRSRGRHGWGHSSESDSNESRGYGGFVSSCRCPFSASGRWGSGGLGGLGSVDTQHQHTPSQDNGYYQQWYRAFASHPCCSGRQGVITSFQRTRTRGYRTGLH